jgi:hypothetical protein
MSGWKTLSRSFTSFVSHARVSRSTISLISVSALFTQTPLKENRERVGLTRYVASA